MQRGTVLGNTFDRNKYKKLADIGLSLEEQVQEEKLIYAAIVELKPQAASVEIEVQLLKGTSCMVLWKGQTRTS
jgi:hypothetical protein